MINKRQELEKLGIVTGNKTTGKTHCPSCTPTRKNKTDQSLSFDVNEGVYNCHNCHFQGSVVAYKPKVKDYSIPTPIVERKISDKALAWFHNVRFISPATISKCGVTETKEWMPQTNKEENAINFNYFREGKLVNVKYRDARKNFKMFKNAEMIFYGLDDIKNSDWCVIVEGEIDKLSFAEIGIDQVISVPNGASTSLSPNLDYLDNCIEYFDNKKKIILAMDTDEVGITLRNELARRLGYERCYKVNFDDCKDANEYLVKYGQKLKEVISDDNIKEFPISGVVTIGDIWDDLENLFEVGVSHGDQTGKIPRLDEHLSFFVGQLMVLTGIPNHGKSPFALFCMACLSVRYGWKWGVVTPEHNPLSLFMVKLMELLLGKKVKEKIGFADAEKILCKNFIGEHFFFIQPENDDMRLDNILEKADMLVVQKGIKGLLIDPWNKLEHQIQGGDSEHNYISRELDKIIRFNQRKAVFTIIVAHPKKVPKQYKSEAFEIPNLYDISGSSNWYNKPDVGVTFYRDFETNVSQVHIKKMKYEHQGKVGIVRVKYNPSNGRFYGNGMKQDNTNWLDTPFQVALLLDENLQEVVKEVEKITTEQNEDDDNPF